MCVGAWGRARQVEGISWPRGVRISHHQYSSLISYTSHPKTCHAKGQIWHSFATCKIECPLHKRRVVSCFWLVVATNRCPHSAPPPQTAVLSPPPPSGHSPSLGHRYSKEKECTAGHTPQHNIRLYILYSHTCRSTHPLGLLFENRPALYFCNYKEN